MTTCAACKNFAANNPQLRVLGFGFCEQSRGWVKLCIERPNKAFPCKPEAKKA